MCIAFHPEIAKAPGMATDRLHKNQYTVVSELRSKSGRHGRDGHREQT